MGSYLNYDGVAMRRFRWLTLLCAVLAPLSAQTSFDPDVKCDAGPDGTPLRILHQPKPTYPRAAKLAGAQGTVRFKAVLDENGRLTDIELVNPVGFELDEAARAAVEQWVYTPCIRDGKKVKILLVLDVNFAIDQVRFDRKLEKQRAEYNLTVKLLFAPGVDAKDAATLAESILKLAADEYPPALYLAGIWQINGEHVAKNPAEGLEWIQKAAEKDHGTALYYVAIRRIEGRELPLDVERGVKEMLRAAKMGSQSAQFYAGNLYEKGEKVERNPGKAKDNYRLCAARGVAMCQYRLANLMLEGSEVREKDRIQALAWLQLAAEQGVVLAVQRASQEITNLQAEQVRRVKAMKAELVRR